jgi:hypothetical protein
MSDNGGHGHVVPRADGVRARCGGPKICSVCAADLALEVAVGVLAATPTDSGKSAHDQEHEEATLRYATEASTGGSLTPDQILARIGDGEIGPSLQAHMITQGRAVAALKRELDALKKPAQAVGQSDAASRRAKFYAEESDDVHCFRRQGFHPEEPNVRVYGRAVESLLRVAEACLSARDFGNLIRWVAEEFELEVVKTTPIDPPAPSGETGHKGPVGQSRPRGGLACRCPVRPYFSIGSLGSGSAAETQAVARWDAEHGRHPYARARDELSQALQKAEGAVGSGAAVLDMVHDVFELKRPSAAARQTDSAREGRAAADMGTGPERP